MIKVEQHKLGPRWYVLGKRVHEYQLGLAMLAANGMLLVSELVGVSRATEGAALLGSWLVVKDWRDLFPGKRDKAAHRRIGIHRPPADSEKSP